MYKARAAVVVGLAIVLSSCCLWKKPADPGGVLVPANTYGEIPAGAKVVSNRKFLRRVADEKLKVLSPQVDRKAALVQFESDVQTLQAIPEAQRSPSVQVLLADVAEGTDPLHEGITPVVDANGDPRKVQLLSLAVRARSLVEAERVAADPDNSRVAYRMAYEAAPTSARAGLAVPDALAGSTLAAIEEARRKLEAALWIEPALDGVRAEATVAHAAPAHAAPASAAPDPPPVPTAACPISAGKDGPGACGHSVLGVYDNFWWPLKRFVTPIRSQGNRGTCWAFAAIAAVESKELVVNGKNLNLSEQYFIYRSKLAGPAFDEGGWGASALASFRFPDVSALIPSESYWQYNPSCLRPDPQLPLAPFKGSCFSYTGTCSETASQGPITCTSALFGSVCGVQKFAYQGTAGVPAVGVAQVWKSGQDLDLASLRALLANGQSIIASFDVYRGFEDTDEGFVTDFSPVVNGEKGAHEVLFVGFITNDELEPVVPNASLFKGGGYFIAKNSWGCDADGGYHYVPVGYVKKFFSRLFVAQVPPERSLQWIQAKQSAGEAPKVQITQPFLSTDVALAPHAVDFGKEIALTGIVKDAQDGAGCCTSTLTWTLVTRPTPDAAWSAISILNSDASTNVLPHLLAGAKEARLELIAFDSDKNRGRATLWLADIEPAIQVVSPLPQEALFTGVDHTFEAKVKAPGSLGDLDCSQLRWRSEPANGQGEVVGCTPTFKWTSAGPFDLVVEGLHGVNPMKASVPVKLIVNGSTGPPEIAIFVEPNDNPSDSGARVRYTILDPDGPGMADLGKYQLTWELEYHGEHKPADASQFLFHPEVIIESRKTFAPECDTSPDLVIHVTVVDPKGEEDTASAPFTYTQPPCIN